MKLNSFGHYGKGKSKVVPVLSQAS